MELEPTTQDVLHFTVTCHENIVPLQQAKTLLKQLDAALLDTLSRPEGACNNFTHFEDAFLSITPPKIPTINTDIQFLHQFVEQKAQMIPGSVALEWVNDLNEGNIKRRSWTYAELNTEGNRVAQFLRRRGAKATDLVGICFEKCPEASFAILGILKVGCTYVAIDPSAPARRKKFVLQDSGATLVLTKQKEGKDLTLGSPDAIICMDDVDVMECVHSMPGVPIDCDIDPSTGCYCLYTSGISIRCCRALQERPLTKYKGPLEPLRAV